MIEAGPDAAEWVSVGGAIRERRRSRSLTMIGLAELCELSQPFLSQVENGRAKPSMASLYRIARALDTTPQALFGARSGAGSTPMLVRQHDAPGVPVLARAEESAVRLLLAGDSPFHVLEFVGMPTEFMEFWEHDGFEAIYVLAGQIEIEVGGALSTLSAGDFVSYPAHLPHRHRSLSGDGARVLMIETTVEALPDKRPSTHVPTLRRKRTTRVSGKR